MSPESVEVFYDGISSEYEALRFRKRYHALVAKREQDYVEAAVGTSGRILEIGAGTGRFTELLVKNGNEVTVVEFSSKMLDIIRARIPEHKVRLLRANFLDTAMIPDFGSYDAVVCMRVLSHVEDVRRGLDVICAALKPGGQAVVDLWNDRSFPILLRKIVRRQPRVRTSYLHYRQMIHLLESAGFGIYDKWGWGFPRIGQWSVDALFDRFARRYAYSVVFHIGRI